MDSSYKVPITLSELPPVDSPIHAIARAAGPMLLLGPAKKLEFGGYEWEVRQTAGSPAGTLNRYDTRNAWVDDERQLHLRVQKRPDGWTSAQVNLFRSLGYGTYRFVVRDISRFEPPVVLTISLWDGSGPYREMDIELSRWGELRGKNAQYVLQPYYIPANAFRFLAPAGRLTYLLDWQPGRATFRTLRGSGESSTAEPVATHVFTSGVPSAGTETLQFNLYVVGNPKTHLQSTVEAVVEKFEYLP